MFYQLGKKFNIKTDIKRGVPVYVVDGFDTPKATVQAMLKKNLVPICYFSAGTYENWRPDIKRIPKSVFGKNLPEWEGEYWFDIRAASVKALAVSRMKMCKAKGFKAVDPDNVDAYANDSGFKLTEEDQLSFLKYLSAEAHKLGLSIGLKNNGGQISKLQPFFDFSVNEECFAFDECDDYLPFIKAKKPVWNVEYDAFSNSAFLKKVCPKAKKLGILSSKNHLLLDGWWLPCP